jgi:hypothetical protein
MPYSHKPFMGDSKNTQGDLVQGTLDMLVLKALSRGPRHGYAVAEWIQQTSDGWTDGVFFQLQALPTFAR